MQTSNIILRTSRLTITAKRKPLTMSDVFNRQFERQKKAKLKLELEQLDQQKKTQYEVNFEKPNNAFIISKASKRKIYDSINNLYTLSDKRTIDMRNGKQLYNFRCSFITLTLPAKQRHTDTYIKQQCINQFLVEIRKNYGVTNWIWKAELQKNDNIHFHLIIDKYIDFQALRRRWNRITEKLGYVTAYQQNMSQLSLLDYHKIRNKYAETSFEVSQKAYAKGKKDNWKNPNSVDVRSVLSTKDLGSYLAKYISKDVKLEELSKEEIERGQAFGRIWSRSYSLVSLDANGSICAQEFKVFLNYLNSGVKQVKKVVGDYFTAYYYNLDNLPNLFKFELRKFFKSRAYYLGYKLPVHFQPI